MSGKRSGVRRTEINMASIKIGATDVTPISPQTGNVNQAAREIARSQVAPARSRPFNPYAAVRQDAITCRETVTGTYEAILGSDAVIHDQIPQKGQIIDFWV